MGGDFSTRTKLCVSFLEVFAVPRARLREEAVSLFPSRDAARQLCPGLGEIRGVSVRGLLSLPGGVKVASFRRGEESGFS